MLSGNTSNSIELTGHASGVIDGSAHRNTIGGTLRAGTRMNWVISNYTGRGRFGCPLPNRGQPASTWAAITTS